MTSIHNIILSLEILAVTTRHHQLFILFLSLSSLVFVNKSAFTNNGSDVTIENCFLRGYVCYRAISFILVVLLKSIT